jgi:glycosyltransferase involved in cell wall biosynthesis
LCVDPGAGSGLGQRLSGVRIVEATHTGQAAALNTGIAICTGDLLAFIEDDDVWHPEKIRMQLAEISGTNNHVAFVSSDQLEFDESGRWLRVNEFPTPSTWLMTRELWDRVGDFDESFRWHLDTEWLGRLNRLHVQRMHLIAPVRPLRESLLWIAKHSLVRATQERIPLVGRTVNPRGGMQRIAEDSIAAAESREEYARMRAAFGGIPW